MLCRYILRPPLANERLHLLADWHELLRRTFGEDVRCHECGGRLRLIAMVKTQATIQEILTGMG